MRPRSMFASLILSLLVAPGAHAGGVNLRWNNCVSEGGAANRNFACNTNLGNNTLTASFVMPALLAAVNGIECTFDVSSAATLLPVWWGFKNTGSCRQNSLTANFSMNPSNVICQDWSAGSAIGSLASYTLGQLGLNTARIVDIFAVPVSLAADLEVGPEYFAGNLQINNVKTLGAGSCAGCSTPACIAVESIQIAVASNFVSVLTQPANGTDSNFVTWQGGAGVPPLPNGACPAAVPTRSSTWSGLKSLYR